MIFFISRDMIKVDPLHLKRIDFGGGGGENIAYPAGIALHWAASCSLSLQV